MGIVAELTITAMEVSNLPAVSPFDVVPAELSLVVLLALNGGLSIVLGRNGWIGAHVSGLEESKRGRIDGLQH
jgi:hypothetical protein